MSQPLLTIAIPTYNRAAFLDLNLKNLISECEHFSDLVEIIISDNASTDDTKNVVSKYIDKYSFIQYFRNENNIGAKNNFFLLTDCYSKGNFCWLLGDDDFVKKGAIQYIIDILRKSPDLYFVGLQFDINGNIDLINNDLINKDLLRQNTFECTLAECVNLQSSPSNLLSTFITSFIFRRENFAAFDKTTITGSSWSDNFNVVFPHTFVIINSIAANAKSIYISIPLIDIIEHPKSWDDKMPLINIYYLVHLYKEYIRNGFLDSDLKNAKRILIKQGVFSLFSKKIIWKYKRDYFYLSIKTIYFYIVLCKCILYRTYLALILNK